MSTSLGDERVKGPMGTFRISTIQTFAGGGADYSFGPFADSDYAPDSPWPYETMVFPEKSSTGLYHEPYASESEARKGHQRIANMVREGVEFPGKTVSGPFGNPSLTPEQWEARVKAGHVGLWERQL